LFFSSILFIPFLIFGIVVMYSRIYIKSHYLRDIIAGALIGVVIGIVFIWLNANLRI